MNYRILGPDEVIHSGDEWFDGTPCDAVIGESVWGYYKGRIRRPVSTPDNLTRELAEALKVLLRNAEDKAKYISHLEDSEEIGNDDNVVVNYSPEMDQARAVLAKYKEQVKVYETVDGKAAKCA